MSKKIIISSLAFFGMSLIALYRAESKVPITEDKIENDFSVNTPIVVLELFTSQGCSSCPPADVLLNKAKNQFPDEVFALSYHVDYWNYIGWKDPFSKSVYAKKQREYNRKFGYNGNYTPQMVVNGKEHFVGSSASKVYAKIASYSSQESPNKVALVNPHTSKGKVDFDYSIVGDFNGKQLRIVLVLDERTTSVKRGENRNRVLTNSNIVVTEKYITPIGNKGSSSITIPEIVTSSDNLTLLVLVEADNLDITAAAKSALP